MAIQFIYEFDGVDGKETVSLLTTNCSYITPWTIEIKRKNANNNRQTSWWKKVVLFGLRIQRAVGLK